MSSGRETSDIHHEELVNGLFKQLKIIFESSEQSIYLYLDDAHKVCNNRFASMLGYKSPRDWSNAKEPFDAFVDSRSFEPLVSAYRNAMTKMVASTVDETWRKRPSGTVDSTVILVPIAYEGRLFALHFISPKAP